MSKRILFLFTNQYQKAELLRCEPVFKAILRKFRKSAIFKYMELDLSPACQETLTKSLKDVLAKSDEVLWHHDAYGLLTEKAFAQKALGMYCEESFCVGRCVFHIPEFTSTTVEKSYMQKTSVIETDSIEKTVSLAANKAESRLSTLTLCTDREDALDNLFLKEAERCLGGRPHLSINHISLDEFIYQSIEKVPLYNTVLATQSTARLISSHMTSMIKAPTGYVLWHTEYGKIYRRQTLPYENMGNLLSASLLLAFAGMLEGTKDYKSCGRWLKKCVGLCLGKICDKDSFLKEVITEINKPIRNRQVKKNDC